MDVIVINVLTVLAVIVAICACGLVIYLWYLVLRHFLPLRLELLRTIIDYLKRY